MEILLNVVTIKSENIQTVKDAMAFCDSYITDDDRQFIRINDDGKEATFLIQSKQPFWSENSEFYDGFQELVNSYPDTEITYKYDSFDGRYQYTAIYKSSEIQQRYIEPYTDHDYEPEEEGHAEYFLIVKDTTTGKHDYFQTEEIPNLLHYSRLFIKAFTNYVLIGVQSLDGDTWKPVWQNGQLKCLRTCKGFDWAKLAIMWAEE